MTKYELEDFNIDNWEDPIVAEVRAIREAHAVKFGFDLNLIFEDFKANREKLENMGFKFVTSESKIKQDNE